MNLIKSSVLSFLLSTALFCLSGGLAALAQDQCQLAQAGQPAPNNESPRIQAIRAMVRQSVQEQGIPGYAIAIVQNGNVVFSEACGKADLDAYKMVDQDTIFGLASLTKTFTGLALLHLIDEGKVKATDTLDKYLGNLPDRWKKMTIFQLASMRAGLPESRNDEQPWPQEMRYLEGQPLAYEADKKHIYSNPSYRVLGTVIEAVTGMPFLEYLNQTIFEPLQMHSTGTCESMAPTGKVSCPWAYGWGASVNAKINQRVNGMNGGLPGVASSIMLLPDSKIAVVALANLRHKPVYNIAKKAMLIYVGADLGGSGMPGEGEEAGPGPGQ